MGYLTKHTLEWNDDNFKIPEEFNGLYYAIGDDGNSLDSVKWYDCHEDMIELSEQFPTILFTLSGEGEESGDIWKTYYLGGKHQYTKAEIVFEEFDESKLV